jgi:hypothetical protein
VNIGLGSAKLGPLALVALTPTHELEEQNAHFPTLPPLILAPFAALVPALTAWLRLDEVSPLPMFVWTHQL